MYLNVLNLEIFSQELREKNWKAMDALSKAEKQGEAATAKDAQIETLTQQLQEAKKAAVSSSSGW